MNGGQEVGAGLGRTVDLTRISDYPAYHAGLTPEADAVVSGAGVLSYREFQGRIDDAARAMLVRGVRRGDRVATMSPPSPQHLVHFMAAARIGAAWVGLNPRYTADEFEVVLRDAAPRLVLVEPEVDGRDYRPTFAGLAEQCLTDAVVASLGDPFPGLVGWDEMVAAGARVPEDAFDAAVRAVTAEDVATIVYTSGTTGTPKGAMLSHRSIVTTARIQCEHWWAVPFRILNNLPINHIGGAVQIACHALVAGGANVIMERFDPVGLPAVVRDRGVTVIHQVPTMYQLVLDRGAPAVTDFASLQALIWSGAAASPTLVGQLRQWCERLYTSYGQTETGGEVLYSSEWATDEELAGWVGVPDPRIAVRVAASRPADAGELTGELQVRGPTVMTGYRGRPEDTAATFTEDGWLRTGDLAEVGPDGRHRIVGRLREMFKSGGYNVYPREVERVLELHPGVRAAAVLGVADDVFGEVGEAWVLASEDLSREALEEHCRAHLANYKVPKAFHLRSDLPMLPIGKIDKVALRDRGVRPPASGSTAAR